MKPEERETIIQFDDSTPTKATIWTCKKGIIQKLEKWGYVATHSSRSGKQFTVDKKCILVRKVPKRTPRPNAHLNLRKSL